VRCVALSSFASTDASGLYCRAEVLVFLRAEGRGVGDMSAPLRHTSRLSQ
jgi:hypothetical protein